MGEEVTPSNKIKPPKEILPPKDIAALGGNSVKTRERVRGNPPKETEPAKEVEQPREAVPPECCLNRDPIASKSSTAKDSGGKKGARAVPIVKVEDQPPDPARVYRSGDSRYLPR